ncbi:MAG TPA: di-heme oxidoredictase family protein [Gemmatimonadaceae bacterium]|nr:di-heme oxidoredictase family protein [Gemmatimonadaceae bacterium]
MPPAPAPALCIRTAALLIAVGACGVTDPVLPAAADTAVLTAGTDPASGGAMTVLDASATAFGQPGPTLTTAQRALHDIGDKLFDANFVPDPTADHGGLGPRFVNVACAACHLNDGRGSAPQPGGPFASLLFRVSVPGVDAHGGPAPLLAFGTQLEFRGAPGLPTVAMGTLSYADSIDQFADGTPDTLHVPAYGIAAPYRVLPATVLLSPRLAPPNFGLGLLEAVPDATIEALAGARAAVAAGVAGHPNRVWDPTAGRLVLGRFGLKANVGSLLQQTAAAFNTDMGVTSSFLPTEPCSDAIAACGAHAPDVSDSVRTAVTADIRTLAVPARRNPEAPAVRRGQALFASAGCALCHTPTLQTGTVAGDPELSAQTIHPYTDLLLHDMGAGLADGRPDYLATGREWRTPPLWGIGLTGTVSRNVSYLHDGRARSLLEAIMWHGGQAAAARAVVRGLSRADRDALLAFLQSL